MKIVFVTSQRMGLSGGALRAHVLARGLVEAGHDVTLLATPGKALLPGPVKIVTLPLGGNHRFGKSGLDPVSVFQRLRWARSVSADIVQTFDHRPAGILPALAIRRRTGAKLVFDWSDRSGFGGVADTRTPAGRLVLGTFDSITEPWAMRRADGIVVINRNLMQQARDITSVPIHRLGVGADIMTVQPFSKAAARQQHNIPQDALVVLHVGHSRYDESLLVESFLQIAARHTRAILISVGGLSPSAVSQLALLGDRVWNMPQVPHEAVASWLATADVLLAPYADRPVNLTRLPHKIGDYLAAGRPIVSNTTGDMPLLLGGAGVVTNDNPTSVADAVCALFDDPEKRDLLGLLARARAIEIDWSVLATELAAFYTRLTDESASRPSRDAMRAV